MPSGDVAIVRAGGARPRITRVNLDGRWCGGDRRRARAARPYGFWAIDPMPGGARLGGEGAQTPGGVDGARAEADELGAPVAVDEARGPGAAAAFGCARAGAEPAVEAAAAVRHGGLATGAAGASAGAAARGAQVVAAGVAVLEAAAPGVRGGVEFSAFAIGDRFGG